MPTRDRSLAFAIRTRSFIALPLLLLCALSLHCGSSDSGAPSSGGAGSTTENSAPVVSGGEVNAGKAGADTAATATQSDAFIGACHVDGPVCLEYYRTQSGRLVATDQATEDACKTGGGNPTFDRVPCDRTKAISECRAFATLADGSTDPEAFYVIVNLELSGAGPVSSQRVVQRRICSATAGRLFTTTFREIP